MIDRSIMRYLKQGGLFYSVKDMILMGTDDNQKIAKLNHLHERAVWRKHENNFEGKIIGGSSPLNPAKS